MNRRVVLYAVAVVTAAALVSSVLLLWRPGVAIGPIALAALAPSLLLGFIGLASRYLCRAMPLRTSSVTGMITTHGGSAAAASGVWVLTWNASAAALDQTLLETPFKGTHLLADRRLRNEILGRGF